MLVRERCFKLIAACAVSACGSFAAAQDAASQAIQEAAERAASAGEPIEPDLTIDRTYARPEVGRAVVDRGGRLSDWDNEISARFWFPSLNGDIAIAGGPAFDGDRIAITEVRGAIAVEGVHRFDGGSGEDRGRWSILYDGFYFRIDEDSAVEQPVTFGSQGLAAGTTLSYEVEWASAMVAPSYRFFMLDLTKDGDAIALNPWEIPSDGVGVWFEVYGGARLQYLSADVSSGGTQFADDDRFWADALVGGRLTMDLPHGFLIDLESDLGVAVDGESGGVHWNIEVGLSYEAVEGVAAEIGFRHLQIDYEGVDDFEAQTSLAGIFGSLVIRF